MNKHFLKSKTIWIVILSSLAVSFTPYVEVLAKENPKLWTSALLFVFSVLRFTTNASLRVRKGAVKNLSKTSTS